MDSCVSLAVKLVQSNLPLIVAVFRIISVEYTLRISSLSAFQFTAEKSDFK